MVDIVHVPATKFDDRMYSNRHLRVKHIPWGTKNPSGLSLLHIVDITGNAITEHRQHKNYKNDVNSTLEIGYEEDIAA